MIKSRTVASKFSTNSMDVGSADESPSDSIRRGSRGPVGSVKLLKSYQSLHAPFTQVSIIFQHLLSLSVFLHHCNLLLSMFNIPAVFFFESL